ncbi:hypothetical protein EE612_035467 [Oryza sativa]|jgi:hypothetical protein|nr:hypothetical protein EE612_035467 [Oryza sativa]
MLLGERDVGDAKDGEDATHGALPGGEVSAAAAATTSPCVARPSGAASLHQEAASYHCSSTSSSSSRRCYWSCAREVSSSISVDGGAKARGVLTLALGRWRRRSPSPPLSLPDLVRHRPPAPPLPLAVAPLPSTRCFPSFLTRGGAADDDATRAVPSARATTPSTCAAARVALLPPCEKATREGQEGKSRIGERKGNAGTSPDAAKSSQER